jgi:hypothetical protein
MHLKTIKTAVKQRHVCVHDISVVHGKIHRKRGKAC